MKKFKIRAVCTLLTAVMGLTVMAGCGAKTLDGTKTVVTVESNEIPLGVASFALRYAQAQTEYYYSAFSAMYGSESGMEIWDKKNDDGTTHGDTTKADVIDKIQKMYLVRDHAEEYGVKVTDEEKEGIKTAAQAFVENNEESLLKQMGVTQADIEEYLELETYYRKAEKPFVADVEIEITDSEAAQSTISYTAVSIKAMSDEEKEAAKEKLQELLEEYKQSDDIANLDMKAIAEEKEETYISTTSSFGEDDTTLEDAVKEAAKDLSEGQLYDGIAEGENSYYIVRMDKVLDEEATESKKETIKAEKQQEAFDELVQGWLDNAKVSLDKGVWKKVTLTDKESYTMKIDETSEEDADLVPEDALEEGEGEDADAAETPAEEEASEETPEETPAAAEETAE